MFLQWTLGGKVRETYRGTSLRSLQNSSATSLTTWPPPNIVFYGNASSPPVYLDGDSTSSPMQADYESMEQRLHYPSTSRREERSAGTCRPLGTPELPGGATQALIQILPHEQQQAAGAGVLVRPEILMGRQLREMTTFFLPPVLPLNTQPLSGATVKVGYD